jgi:hypothetical protein
MIKTPHNLDLLNETLLTVFLTVRTLLRKCLHCVIYTVLQFLCEVHGRKITLPDLLKRLELLVEPALVEPALQHLPPAQQLVLGLQLVPDGVPSAFEGDLKGVLAEGELKVEIEGDRPVAVLGTVEFQ